jgi:hypothetical protein
MKCFKDYHLPPLQLPNQSWILVMVCAVVVSLSATVAASGGPTTSAPATHSYIDRSLYPKAYGILTSEHLMFPDNVADWPVKIDSRHQLFVDDYLIASMKGLRREFGQAAKHPANPVIRTDRPWERSIGGTGSNCVLRDGLTGRFRMWYNVGKSAVLYAESDDGLAWRKPDLGLFEHDGSKDNNIVIPSGYIAGLVADPRAPGFHGRYMAFISCDPPYVDRQGFYLHVSDDGVHWTGELRRPVLAPTTNPLLPAVGVGDTSIFRYDPLLGKYFCDTKFNPYFPDEVLRTLLSQSDGKNRIRSRALSESDDLVHWTPPCFTFFPDEHDEPDAQMYGHIPFAYESMWLGLLRVMHIARTGWKQVEIELTYSRDGRHWLRPAKRQPFIALGPPGSWEPDYSDPAFTGPLAVGDQLWFYYRGSRSASRDRQEAYTSAVGLAHLRQDGFASLNAGPVPGRVVTRPLTFDGRSLYTNVEIAEGGSLKAALLSEAGQPLPSYGLESCVVLKDGTTKGRITWRDAAKLTIQAGDHVRLLFELQNAKLYSFWIE